MSKTFWSVKANGIGWLSTEIFWFDDLEEAYKLYQKSQAADSPIAHRLSKKTSIYEAEKRVARTRFELGY